MFYEGGSERKKIAFILEITPRPRSFLVSGVACECTWATPESVDLFKVRNILNQYRWDLLRSFEQRMLDVLACSAIMACRVTVPLEFSRFHVRTASGGLKRFVLVI